MSSEDVTDGPVVDSATGGHEPTEKELQEEAAKLLDKPLSEWNYKMLNSFLPLGLEAADTELEPMFEETSSRGSKFICITVDKRHSNMYFVKSRISTAAAYVQMFQLFGAASVQVRLLFEGGLYAMF